MSTPSSLGPTAKLKSEKPVRLSGLLTEQWVRVCLQECCCSPLKAALESLHPSMDGGFPSAAHNGEPPLGFLSLYPLSTSHL